MACTQDTPTRLTRRFSLFSLSICTLLSDPGFKSSRVEHDDLLVDIAEMRAHATAPSDGVCHGRTGGRR